MDKKRKYAGWLVLTVIAVVAAIALALTDRLTEEPIRRQNMERTHGALTELFPEADDFTEMPLSDADEMQSAYTAKQQGETVGYAVTVATQGYAGPVEVIVGLDSALTLRGIRVGGSGFQETEGLGSKAKEPAFTEQFQGKQPPLVLGEDIEGISGATVTSSAVVAAVNQAMEFFVARLHTGDAATAPPTRPTDAPSTTEHTANASVIGYAGPVLVRLTLDEQGAIQALTIGGARMDETPGLGAKVAEESFAAQFVGKTPPIRQEEIELIAGATQSSLAALEAIDQAAAFINETP